MKLIIIAAISLSLSACGAWSRGVASTTGYDTTCVGGVEYIQFVSGVTVAYSPDGKIKTCSK